MTTGDAPPQVAVEAAVQGAILADAVQPVTLRSGTVMAYSEAPPARVMVLADGQQGENTTETPARNVLNQPLTVGSRVVLAWGPTGECIVIGIIGRVPYPSMLVQRTTNLNIADNAEATVGPWSTTRYTYAGGTVHSSNGLTVPFTGLWSTGARFAWEGILPTTVFYWVAIQRMAADGTTLKEPMAQIDGQGNGWAVSDTITRDSWPLNAGEIVRLRVKQYTLTTGAARNLSYADLSMCWVGSSDDVMV